MKKTTAAADLVAKARSQSGLGEEEASALAVDETRRARAAESAAALRADAARSGAAELSDQEIEAEIRDSRRD